MSSRSQKEREFFEAKKKEAEQEERSRQEAEERLLAEMSPEERQEYLDARLAAKQHEERKGKMLTKQFAVYGKSSGRSSTKSGRASKSRGAGPPVKPSAVSTRTEQEEDGSGNENEEQSFDSAIGAPPGIQLPQVPPGLSKTAPPLPAPARDGVPPPPAGGQVPSGHNVNIMAPPGLIPPPPAPPSAHISIPPPPPPSLAAVVRPAPAPRPLPAVPSIAGSIPPPPTRPIAPQTAPSIRVPPPPPQVDASAAFPRPHPPVPLNASVRGIPPPPPSPIGAIQHIPPPPQSPTSVGRPRPVAGSANAMPPPNPRRASDSIPNGAAGPPSVPLMKPPASPQSVDSDAVSQPSPASLVPTTRPPPPRPSPAALATAAPAVAASQVPMVNAASISPPSRPPAMPVPRPIPPAAAPALEPEARPTLTPVRPAEPVPVPAAQRSVPKSIPVPQPLPAATPTAATGPRPMPPVPAFPVLAKQAPEVKVVPMPRPVLTAAELVAEPEPQPIPDAVHAAEPAPRPMAAASSGQVLVEPVVGQVPRPMPASATALPQSEPTVGPVQRKVVVVSMPKAQQESIDSAVVTEPIVSASLPSTPMVAVHSAPSLPASSFMVVSLPESVAAPTTISENGGAASVASVPSRSVSFGSASPIVVTVAPRRDVSSLALTPAGSSGSPNSVVIAPEESASSRALAAELQTIRQRAEELQKQHRAAEELATTREAQLQLLERQMTAASASLKEEQQALLQKIQASKDAETAALQEQLQQRSAEVSRREAQWAQERAELEQQLRAALGNRQSAEHASAVASQELQAKLEQSHAVHLEAAAELLRATEGFRMAAAMRSKVATYEEKLIAQSRKMAALERKLRQAGIDVDDAASVTEAHPRLLELAPSAVPAVVPRQSSARSVQSSRTAAVSGSRAPASPPSGFAASMPAAGMLPPQHRNSLSGAGSVPPPPPPPASTRPARSQATVISGDAHLGVSGFAVSVPLPDRVSERVSERVVQQFRPPEPPWQTAAMTTGSARPARDAAVFDRSSGARPEKDLDRIHRVMASIDVQRQLVERDAGTKKRSGPRSIASTGNRSDNPARSDRYFDEPPLPRAPSSSHSTGTAHTVASRGMYGYPNNRAYAPASYSGASEMYSDDDGASFSTPSVASVAESRSTARRSVERRLSSRIGGLSHELHEAVSSEKTATWRALQLMEAASKDVAGLSHRSTDAASTSTARSRRRQPSASVEDAVKLSLIQEIKRLEKLARTHATSDDK